ncbi:MAG: hypothetical protein LBT14_04085 [Treponema sp.]|jgi:hypothetical protein|nr:hypothetical protein [Treponema sp.]
MAIIVLELPDFIEEKAKARGLLSSELYEDFIQKAIRATDKAINPRDFPVFVKNVVSPDMFSKYVPFDKRTNSA